MTLRKLVLGALVLLACSRSSDEAGIVLNIDTDVTADRTVINHIVVRVDGQRQDWNLTQSLPGSLGIETSPGHKSVTVEGMVGTVLRGQWSGTIAASRGAVIVQDVHLAPATISLGDGGTDARDGSADVATDAKDSGLDTRDGGVDGRDGNVAVGDGPQGEVGGVSGKGGTGGRTQPIDGGTGGFVGTGGVFGTGGRTSAGGSGGSTGADARDALGAADGADGPAPGNDGPPPVIKIFNGAFQVSSQFEGLATAATPGPVGDTLRLVHEFVAAPGAAILGFADDAGVPGLSTLRSALPDAAEGRLAGWIDDYVKDTSVAGITPFDELVWLDDTVQALLLHWGLQSKLDLPAGKSGTHAPLALTFASLLGSPYSIPLDPTAPVTTGVGVSAVVSWPSGSSGPAVLTISDHFMGLPFGRYALQALNAILLAEYGVPNLTKFLSKAIGCPAMAAYVAGQCVDVYLTDICVGHQSDLLDVCEGGLAEGARQIEDQILGLDLKVLHLQRGTATAIGAQVSRPQDATALQDGVWSVNVDFGSGEEAANGSFSAVAATASP